MEPEDIARVIRRVAHEVLERNKGTGDIVIVGIHTRGKPLADRLGRAIAEIEAEVPVGSLEIGMFRDDLRSRPAPTLGPTKVPVDIDNRTVVLVDDVLYTGRTIRAAMDALSALGRPARVELAVLIDRGHRELPIRPDYVGKNLPTSTDQRVTVRLEPIDDADGVWIEEGA